MQDAAYRKGYERGLAASDPTRVITVNLSSFSVPPDTLGIPRWVTLRVQQNTPIRDVLTEIHRRLGDIQYPFTISTLGVGSRELHLEDDLIVMDVLPKFDAEAISLRLNVQIPKGDKEPKKSFGSRLRNAFGAGNDRSGSPHGAQTAAQSNPTEATSSRASMRSQPPPYDEAVRSAP